MRCVTILGVPVHALTIEEAIALCVARVRARPASPTSIAHVNPHTLVLARTDPAVRAAVMAADLRLADGAGLMLVGRLRGQAPPERIPAPDFVPLLTDALGRSGGARYFFYGSTDAVLERLRERIPSGWPSIEVVGVLSPPFRPMSDDEEAEHCRRINEARPDVLWVGMTAPKQELWVERNQRRLEVPLIGSVGAAFDFLADTKARSPKWLSRLGLEWLHRLAFEPRRLWRRTFVSAPLFLWYSLQETWRRAPEPPR